MKQNRLGSDKLRELEEEQLKKEAEERKQRVEIVKQRKEEEKMRELEEVYILFLICFTTLLLFCLIRANQKQNQP